jgi:small-conductance mechanosensitive channel
VIILAIAFLWCRPSTRHRLAVAGLSVIGTPSASASAPVTTWLGLRAHRGNTPRATWCIADVSGTVEDFSLRRTTLRDLDGTVHSVPNGLIGVASNLTRVWARINLDLTVAHGTDLEAASGAVNEIGLAMAADPAWKRRVLEAPRVDRVSSLAGEGVTLKILGSVRAADRWAATGELRKRIATAFAEQGIEIRGV